MTRKIFEVDSSILSNLCEDMPCGKAQCIDCPAYTLQPGDELVLRIKKGKEE
jgi:hypothetical protein